MPQPELYDLAADPGEVHDLAAEQPEVLARLGRLARGHAWSAAGPPPEGEVAAKLAALGYVDAKEAPDVVTAGDDADALAAAGRPEAALALLTEVGGAHPEVVELSVRRVALLLTLRRPAEAEAVARAAVARDPESGLLREALAQALEARGRVREAAELWASLAQEQPQLAGRAVEALGRVGEIDRAVALAERHRDQPRVEAVLGVALMRAGRRAEGAPLIRQAEAAGILARDVDFFAARLAHEAGDVAEAERLLRRERADYPDNPAAALALALVLGQRGALDEQLALVEEVLAQVRAAGGPPGVDLAPFVALAQRGR